MIVFPFFLYFSNVDISLIPLHGKEEFQTFSLFDIAHGKTQLLTHDYL